MTIKEKYGSVYISQQWLKQVKINDTIALVLEYEFNNLIKELNSDLIKTNSILKSLDKIEVKPPRKDLPNTWELILFYTVDEND